MNSNGATGMNLSFFDHVGSVRFLGACKGSDMDRFPIHMNAGQPFARTRAPCSAKQAGAATLPGPAPILHIVGSVSDTEIDPTIVGTNAVNVVNVPTWPLAADDQKRESMGEIEAPHHSYTKVSARTSWASGDSSGFDVAYVDLPRDYAGFLVVVKKPAHLFGKGNICHG